MLTLNDVADSISMGLNDRDRRLRAEEERKRLGEADRISKEADAAGSAAYLQALEGVPSSAGLAAAQAPAAMPMAAGGTQAQGMPAQAQPQTQPGLQQAPQPGRKDGPSQDTQMRAILAGYAARAKKFAQNGDWKNFTETYAKSAPLRAQMRNDAIDKAMQRYTVDGDIESLLKAGYNQIDDGDELQSVKQIQPSDKNPGGYVLEFASGKKTERPLTQQELFTMVQRARADPAKVAEYEYRAQLENAQKEHAARLDREGEEKKHAGRKELEGLQHTNKVKEIEAQSKATRGNQAHAAGLEDAKPFTLSEGETRYGKGGKVVASIPKAPKPDDDVKSTDNLMNLLRDSGFSRSKDPVSGRFNSDPLTQKAAERVKQYRAAGMSLDEAIAKTRVELTQRGILK